MNWVRSRYGTARFVDLECSPRARGVLHRSSGLEAREKLSPMDTEAEKVRAGLHRGRLAKADRKVKSSQGISASSHRPRRFVFVLFGARHIDRAGVGAVSRRRACALRGDRGWAGDRPTDNSHRRHYPGSVELPRSIGQNRNRFFRHRYRSSRHYCNIAAKLQSAAPPRGLKCWRVVTLRRFNSRDPVLDRQSRLLELAQRQGIISL